MTKIRICPTCKEEFKWEREGQKSAGRPPRFCSTDCRLRYWDRERPGRHDPDRTPACKMTDVDATTHLGTCSQHGPNTLAYRGGKRDGLQRWRCSERVRVQPSVVNPKPHSDPVQHRLNKLHSNGIEITREELLAFEARAGGKCEKCKQPTARLQVDHEYLTKRARGLLCTTCNTGIGKLGDDEAGLFEALDYLRIGLTPDEVFHLERVRAAGCKHPALYRHPGKTPIEGWCQLCRAKAIERGDPGWTQEDLDRVEAEFAADPDRLLKMADYLESRQPALAREA